MSLKKISLLLTSALLVGALMGCFGEEGGGDSGISITGFGLSDATDGDKIVDGIVSSAEVIDSIALTVKDSAGVEVTVPATDGNSFVVYNNFHFIRREITDITEFEFNSEDTLALSVEAYVLMSQITNCGSYTLELDVWAGSAQETGSVSFQKTTGCGTGPIDITDTLAVQTAQLGAQGNNLPGSINLDTWQTYNWAASVAVADVIDLYYHAVEGRGTLFTPVAAHEAGFGTATSGPSAWTNANEGSLLYTTNLTAAEFEAINTLEDLTPVLDVILVEESVVNSTPVTTGSVVAVITDELGVFLILIDAQATGNAGSITIKSIGADVI